MNETLRFFLLLPTRSSSSSSSSMSPAVLEVTPPRVRERVVISNSLLFAHAGCWKHFESVSPFGPRNHKPVPTSALSYNRIIRGEAHIACQSDSPVVGEVALSEVGGQEESLCNALEKLKRCQYRITNSLQTHSRRTPTRDGRSRRYPQGRPVSTWVN